MLKNSIRFGVGLRGDEELDSILELDDDLSSRKLRNLFNASYKEVMPG